MLNLNKIDSSEKLSDVSYTELRGNIFALLRCRAMGEHLDAHGIERGHLSFSSYKKVYIQKKTGTKTVKRYSNIYINKNGNKEYVPKKKKSIDSLLKVYHIAMRTEIENFTKIYDGAARIFCNIYNATRQKSAPYIDFDKFVEDEYEVYRLSADFDEAVWSVDSKLANAYVKAQMLKTDYKNEIFLNCRERYRSKNELIAACALKACGIPYEVEPIYPGVSRCRADFGITVSGRKIYIEIAGMMTENDYRSSLLEKRSLARQNNLPFVIIDMTDYPDSAGKRITKLNFAILKDIFINICSGKIECGGEILKPYIKSPLPPGAKRA